MEIIWDSLNRDFFIVVAVYDDVPNNHRFEGIEVFENYIGHVYNWASDVNIKINRTGVHLIRYRNNDPCKRD